MSAAWEQIRRRPAVPLRPYVVEYQGSRRAASVPWSAREVPTTIVPLIVNFGAPFVIGTPEGRHVPVAFPRGFVAGMHSRYATAATTGAFYCIQIDLTPAGACRILGLPMRELTDRAVALDDILGAEAVELTERLYDAPDWSTRFAILDHVFMRRLTRAPDIPIAVARVWRALRETDGRATIGVLSRDVGWSRKHSRRPVPGIHRAHAQDVRPRPAVRSCGARAPGRERH